MSSAGGPGGPRRPELIGASALALALGPVLVLVLVLAVWPAGVDAQTSDVPVPVPTLRLEPAAGPPGTSSAAVVEGFGGCADTTGVVLRPGSVAILWDGQQPVGSAVLVDGAARAPFLVPDAAPAGEQRVVAVCNLDAGLQAEDSFVVESPTPVIVQVPDLVGRPVAEVGALLDAAGLVLGGVSGEGDVVRAQDPASDTPVPVGSAVDVSVEGDVVPDVFVSVPDVGDLTADEARARVEEAGLVLGGRLEGDERVETQLPPAGTLVDVGSLVTVSAGATSVDPVPRLAVLAAAAAALVGAWLLRRVLRSRRDRRWVRRHVRAEPGRTTSSGPVLREDDDGRPTHVVRLEPHLDADPPTLEEVAP